MKILSSWKRFRRAFGRDERGTSTVEFAILVPLYLGVLIAAFESGFMMIRYTMLDRGVDLAVRDLRLGTPTPPTFDEFKQDICANTVLMGDCDETVLVELRPISTTSWNLPTGETNCIEQGSGIDPIDQTEYSVGTNNELMFVRVCALFRPFFPTTPFGLGMPADDDGNYALVVTSAFVNEPSR
ncbi:MAG: pilus assembly protein [Rhodobacteraceae bacterium]|nr:pilus assembly protein [Paracoccaceae bacterium]NNK66678.1 pilus assembly protein [Paracoccaceae bacterium]